MVGALQNTPPPTSNNQPDAIETLHTLFEKWKLLAHPALLNDSRAVQVARASPPPLLRHMATSYATTTL